MELQESFGHLVNFSEAAHSKIHQNTYISGTKDLQLHIIHAAKKISIMYTSLIEYELVCLCVMLNWCDASLSLQFG